jgi:imidazolonepropionase-like amidohydrolase
MGPIVIKAGRLFDGRADAVLERAYVMISGDVITAVGAQSELGSYMGQFEQEIDLGPEVTLLPGLINMHTHMSFSSGEHIFADHQRESYELKLIRSVENVKLALRTGVTTIRDCGTLNSIVFAVRDAVEQGHLQGPRIVASGEGITTTGGHLWFCGIESDSEIDVRRAVRAQVKAGADFIKVFATGGGSTPGTNSLEAQYSEAELRAVTTEAARLGKRVAAHAHGSEGVRNAIAARVTTIEHCSFLTADGIAYEADQGRKIADAGLYVCPTIFRGRSKLLTPGQTSEPPEDPHYVALRQARFQLVRQLIDEGVQIVSGTDAGVTGNDFDDYPGDLVYAAENIDLSPVYTLKTATSIAAEALGRSDLGVLAPGNVADLLAVQGNPLQDLQALLHTRLVMSRGQIVSASSRDIRRLPPATDPLS